VGCKIKTTLTRLDWVLRRVDFEKDVHKWGDGVAVRVGNRPRVGQATLTFGQVASIVGWYTQVVMQLPNTHWRERIRSGQRRAKGRELGGLRAERRHGRVCGPMYEL